MDFFMSFIACLGNCKYQKDGCCGLDNVAAFRGPANGADCAYFVSESETPLTSQNGGDGFTDVSGAY